VEEADLWKTGFTLTSKVSSEMVLEIPELARENQNWKIYRAHILDSAAAEGVVSHLSGAAPKPVDSRELEAWNSSNAVAKYIILEVITDSLLARLMHHELAHTLFSHLAAIFGDLEPIALETPAEWSDHDEPLCEDSHSKSDGTDSARTANIVEGKDVEGAGAATRIVHDIDRDEDHSSLSSELKTTEIHNEKLSGTTPAGIPNIPSTPSTNTTTIYPKDPGDPPNTPNGTSRGDVQETAEIGGQWQRTMRKVNRNDGKASPAPNLADRTSKMATGDGPIPFSCKRPKNTVKHQHKSTQHQPRPNERVNANAQRSNGHPKPKINLPRQQRSPLKGESVGGAANSYTPSSSRQSMPQRLATTSNESDKLVTMSIESDKPSSGEIPRVRLASVRWHTDDVNGPRSGADALNDLTDRSSGQADKPRGWTDASNVSNGTRIGSISHSDSLSTYLGAGGMKRAVDSANGFGSQTETSEGQANVSRAQTDASNASNKAETVGISHGDGASTYLGAMDAKRGVDATDGIGSHMDASNGLTDVPSVQMDAITTANVTQNVSTGPTEPKPPDLPGEGGRWAPTEPNGFYSHADMAIGHGDAQSIQTDALMPANAPETVSIRPLELKTPNSPPGSARERAEHPNGLRNRADTTSGPTDVQSVAHETETAANASKTVSTHPNIPKPPNSPSGDVKRIVDETHNVPTLSRLTRPPEGENRPSVTGQRTGAQG